MQQLRKFLLDETHIVRYRSPIAKKFFTHGIDPRAWGLNARELGKYFLEVIEGSPSWSRASFKNE